jgi:hypothetical protein
MPEITRDQFKRLSENLLKEAPAILKARDSSDKAMDKKSALLQALYVQLQRKLDLPKIKETVDRRGFKTYEFAYREAIYDLLTKHAKQPFEYRPIVNSFLGRALL